MIGVLLEDLLGRLETCVTVSQADSLTRDKETDLSCTVCSQSVELLAETAQHLCGSAAEPAEVVPWRVVRVSAEDGALRCFTVCNTMLICSRSSQVLIGEQQLLTGASEVEICKSESDSVLSRFLCPIYILRLS